MNVAFAFRWFWLHHRCTYCRRNIDMPKCDKEGMREVWERKRGKWHLRLRWP